MAIIKTKKDQEIIVDDEFLELLSRSTWHINKGGYVCATIKRKMVYMHRLITNCPKGLTIDHVNCNKLDNRLENLEIVTKSENTKRGHKNGLFANKGRKAGSKTVNKHPRFIEQEERAKKMREERENFRKRLTKDSN